MRKVIKAAAINQAVCTLKVDCMKLEDDLRQVQNDCTVISHLLQHAVADEDMAEEEKIIFYGSTNDFIELLMPLLKSSKWKVNGSTKQKKFLRVIDEVFKIKHDEKKGFLKFNSLVAAVKEYIDRNLLSGGFL